MNAETPVGWTVQVDSAGNISAPTVTRPQPRFNPQHLRTLRGMMQVSTIILTFTGVILMVAGHEYQNDTTTINGEPYTYPGNTAHFAVWTCGFALLQVAIYMTMNLFRLNPFLILELLTTGIWVVLLIFAGCLMIPYAQYPQLVTRAPAAAFCGTAALTMSVNWVKKFFQARAEGWFQRKLSPVPVTTESPKF